MASASLWNQAALERLGCNVLRLGGLPAHERLRWMAKYGAEVTAASTSYLMRLEFAADETGLDIASALGSLRRVFVGSGGWSLDWARERVARWDAVLHESYGMSQRGFAFSCEEGVLARAGRGVLHGLPHLCLMEIVDPATGHQVVHGEEGEVVITPFGVSAMPLVRYATGDRARFMQAHACRCGRPFDGVEAGTIGRYDDMLRIREVNVWPGAIDQVVFAFPEIGDYRGELTVDSTGREIARIAVEFRGETSVEARAQGLRSVAAALRSKLHLTFLVVEHDGHALRSEDDPTMSATSLKLQRWADRRSSSRDAVSKAKLDLPPVSDS
jgi:phenylacetate-CoA ligase